MQICFTVLGTVIFMPYSVLLPMFVNAPVQAASCLPSHVHTTLTVDTLRLGGYFAWQLQAGHSTQQHTGNVCTLQFESKVTQSGKLCQRHTQQLRYHIKLHKAGTLCS
jgi:hypothetical protein